MKIEIEISDDNEGTAEPWWMIIDPDQNMRCDVHVAAAQVTGPFFSREEAEDVLKCNRHRFARRARVYCASGYMTRQYKNKVRGVS